jgi:DNA segregation ATPase FtsK/SpoIIIE-like protein
MIAAIGLVIGLTLAVFTAFWGTLILTGNFTAAVWAVACLPVVAILVRLVCAAIDSSWYWQWKHRHDRYDNPLPPQPQEDKVLNEMSDDRLSFAESNKVRSDQLHRLDEFAPRVVDVPETTGNPACRPDPEEFAHYTDLALEVIRQEKRASTSLLQRRLNFSFKLASALIIELESRGILGPGEGAQPRAILVDLNAAR